MIKKFNPRNSAIQNQTPLFFSTAPTHQWKTISKGESKNKKDKKREKKKEKRTTPEKKKKNGKKKKKKHRQ